MVEFNQLIVAHKLLLSGVIETPEGALTNDQDRLDNRLFPVSTANWTELELHMTVSVNFGVELPG